MDIIIDTNILRRDLKLKDKNFDILLDYLEKTNSNVILPQIVFEETIGLYERLINERIEDYKKNLIKLNGTLVNTRITENNSIDIHLEKETYKELLKTKLKLTNDSIIPYKNEYLEELVNRAINRIKPLDGKGQQFRDGLLWLTILDIANLTDEKRIIFISDNPTDFADKGANKLALELKNEADNKGVEINYYRTISDFVKEHAIKLSFVTMEWIENNLDFTQIEDIFNQIVSLEDDYVRESSESELEPSETATGHLSNTTHIESKALDFFVYEMSDGRVLLNIDFEFEKEYEMEVEREVEKDRSDYEYQYHIDPETGEMHNMPVFVPRVDFEVENDYKIIYPVFQAKFVITIKEEKVVDYDFKEWYWG